MKLSQEERKTLKGQGILSCRDGEHFAVRVITGNGVMTAKEVEAVSKAAATFGAGKVAFTSRLTVEIMDVPHENLSGLLDALHEAGLETGGTGAKVRPVVACKGTYCVFGLCDTQGLAQQIHDTFYKGWRAAKLPHKFKIAVGGCPNNCMKPDLNDVGLIGARMPRVNLDVCRGCKKCAVEPVCAPQSARLADGKMHIDSAKCVMCGKCIAKCPFGAIETQQEGFRIYIGGRWGKARRVGDRLPGIYTRDEALEMIEKVLLYFKKTAFAGERLGAMIDRVGFETVAAALEGNALLAERDEILAAPIQTRV